MASEAPRASVICPTFNRSSAIVPTLVSVLAQSVAELELIVVSDGCTDDTAGYVEVLARDDARVRLLECGQRHGHPAEPRNLGLAAATGDVIAYIDHDDVWLPGHLESLTRLIRAGAELAATGYEHVDVDGAVLVESNLLEMVWHPDIQLLAPLYEPSRVAHRRGLVESVGGWRQGIGLEDWDLWMRLTDAGHTFSTTAARTVRLLQDRTTRRFQTKRPYRLPVADFDDARRAAACMTELKSADLFDRLKEAAITEAAAWYRTLDIRGGLMTPVGWVGEIGELVHETLQDDYQSQLADLVVLQTGDRFTISLPVWCSSREHVARLESILARVHRSQFEILAASVVASGGTPVGIADRASRTRAAR